MGIGIEWDSGRGREWQRGRVEEWESGRVGYSVDFRSRQLSFNNTN